ncbi:MAG: hypothetical protein ACXVA9_06300 [Bdellovibrionales bacterium]
MGLHQTFQAPTHPWFERDFWGVYTPTADELCKNPDLDLVPGKNWIVEVPVKRHEEDWQIPCTPALPLGEFLKRTSHRDFLLNVLAHDTWSLDKLVDIAAPFDETKRFAVRTEAQKVAMFLRKKAPQWLFAADSSSMVRLRTFESFWIESAIDFWPDFVISNFAAADSLQIDARMAAELERRKKRILWNWNENASQDPLVSIQGIMTNRPSAAQQKWHGRL